jgi:VanZ family protein
VLFLTTSLLITDLALQPGLPAPSEIFGPDKIEHLLAFFVLTVLARMGWPQRGWLTSAVLLGYGIGIELVQGSASFGRTASAADVIADLIGIGLGLIFAGLFRQRSGD